MNQAQRVPYKIVGSLPDRYPRGWFCIGTSYEFTNEKPRRMNHFGTALVGYRGEDGKVHVLDGYCPHMGAHLGDGKIKGNSVACPFHGWVWGADGICEEIAYAKKIPPKAVIKSRPCFEENDLVFVWNDPDGGEPLDQLIPRHPWLDDEKLNWTPWIIDRIPVNSNARELIDNMVDVAHFKVVHMPGSGDNTSIDEFHNTCEGHTFEQIMRSTMYSSMKMESKATYYGPGYMIHSMGFMDMEGNPLDDMKLMSLVINIPTGPDSFEFIAGFKCIMDDDIKGDHTDPKVKQAMDDHLEFQRNSTGVYADAAIWQSKCTIDNPILCDGDGPLKRLRDWYNQFLVPTDQVPESMKEKKVFERYLGSEDQAEF